MLKRKSAAEGHDCTTKMGEFGGHALDDLQSPIYFPHHKYSSESFKDSFVSIYYYGAMTKRIHVIFIPIPYKDVEYLLRNISSQHSGGDTSYV